MNYNWFETLNRDLYFKVNWVIIPLRNILKVINRCQDLRLELPMTLFQYLLLKN